jgi:hypothetical protein
MMRFISFLFLAVIIADGTAYSIPRTNYHYGAGLEFGEVSSTFLGLFYEVSPNDSLTRANQQFLYETDPWAPEYEYKPETYQAGRRYKVIAFDSVFISIYNPQYQCAFLTPYIVLNDLKYGGRYNMRNFTLENYNELIGKQYISKPINYPLLAKLYLVLKSVNDDIYFPEYDYELSEILQKDWFSPINREQNNYLYNIALDKIENTEIDSSGQLVSVSFCVYDHGMNIRRVRIFFNDTTLLDGISATLICGKDLRENMPYERVKRRK